MADRLIIRDDVLEDSGTFLVSASKTMAGTAQSVPSTALESLTGIDDGVRRYLNGLQTARSALADAAKTASGELVGAMRDGSELDARIAGSLYDGFAVRGSGR